MSTVIFMILRRMRAPLLLISAVYAIATLGLTLIPGVDDKGQVFHMNFFEAFYFVSIMGTTIGFGEIPYPFTDAQRMWTIMFLYITVATWIYVLGALITLLSNDVLKNAFTAERFARQVRNLSEPFFLICGYGDTGSKLVRSLRRRLIQATVIDIKQERVDALMLEDDPMYVPALCADAADPGNLTLAGIEHPMCQAVVAITNDNSVNLHIAISGKVLNPDLRVICRADSHEVESNMASFGTEYIIDPFDTFAKNLALATYAPYQFLLIQWFRQARGEPLSRLTRIPQGLWIICGFGRFGKAIHKELIDHDVQVCVIENDAGKSGLPPGSTIGQATEAPALIEAGIEHAVGVIAGTSDDSNNLSIVVTARELNPELFVIVRQTDNANHRLFAQSEAQIVMEPSEVIAGKIRTLLTNPVIDDFLSLARAHDDNWARILAERLRAISPDYTPHTWSITIGEEQTPAVAAALAAGDEVRIEHLIRDHTDRESRLPVVVLFHGNGAGAYCIPVVETPLEPGDRLLFAGTISSHSKLLWNLANDAALYYVRTGKNLPQTLLGRWLMGRAYHL